MELHELTVAQAARRIRKREISPVEVVEALLRRIEAVEGSVQAWETIDREGALAAARACEAAAGAEAAGPLNGVPIGVKDIFYTKGLRTTSGSPMFAEFVPTYDATSIAKVRQAGAIILGKTVTVQFAHHDVPKTRNPWNPDRTPGGSSSGSAAAVAARMVPGALGTQTGGSVLRPASYCGIVGLKPTYGLISRYGITPASWSLDHVGVHARTVEDTAFLLQAMAGHDPLDHASERVRTPDYLAAARKEKPPSIAMVPDFLPMSQPEIADRLQQVVERFRAAGTEVREVPLPAPFQTFMAIRNIIALVEAASTHIDTLREHPEGYEPAIRAQVETGMLVPGEMYLRAQRVRRQLRPQVEEMLEGVDCLLLPTVSNVAPDRSTTGDARFQQIWSLFGFPSITLPSGLNSEGLPIGTQLVALPFREDALLTAAAWAEALLDPVLAPPDSGAGI